MIRTIIVDDSVVYRTQIRAAIQDLPNIEILATASNGKLALERLKQSEVDLVILDLEMPEMDGLTTLKEMAKLGVKSKVLVFSSASKRGSEVTMEALKAGASDFITKPDGSQSSDKKPDELIRDLLAPKIAALFNREPVKIVEHSSEQKVKNEFPNLLWGLFAPDIVVIGSSTGGPTVLEKIFSQISGDLLCPIVIAQHMPPIFTATLAERISKLCGIPAKEAQNGELLKNQIYIAPGDYHLRLQGTKGQVKLVLDQGPQINSVRPAVDPLFETASSIFKNKCLAFVLTGMGMDGKAGAISIKKNGGAVVIQEEKSCVVFGMPGAVFQSGAYDRIEKPEEIIEILRDKVAPYGKKNDVKEHS